jgi:hypothetical protein
VTERKRWVLFMSVMLLDTGVLALMRSGGVTIPLWIVFAPIVAGPFIVIAGGFIALFFRSIFFDRKRSIR